MEDAYAPGTRQVLQTEEERRVALLTCNTRDGFRVPVQSGTASAMMKLSGSTGRPLTSTS
jgi:hypothetical protein